MDISTPSHYDKISDEIHRKPGGKQKIHDQYGLWIFRLMRRRRTPSKPAVQPRTFDFYGFCHLTNGKGWYWTGGDSVREVLPGQGILTFPGFRHDYGGYDTFFEEDALSFTGPVADHLRQAGILHNGIVELGSARRLLPVIEAAADPSHDSQIRANMALQNLLVDLHFEHLQTPATRDYPEIDRLIRTLRDHPDRIWTVESMADFCNLGLTRFRIVFRKRTGHSPKEFIDRERIQQACEMLCTSRRAIVAIATRIGYADPCHFSRRFKEIIGLSPKAYRKRFLG
jgi:AraC-like DNA-binding protein